MGEIRLDKADERVWEVVFPDKLDEGAYLKHSNELHASLLSLPAQRRVCLVVDLSTLSSPPRSIQEEASSFWKDKASLERAVCGVALVSPNSFLRGAIAAFGWVFPIKVDITAHQSLDDARSWCDRCARASSPSTTVS